MNCNGCGKAINPKGVSGYCRPCHARKNSSDPSVRAKLSAAIISYARANPTRMSERAKKSVATKRTDPELMARMADNMRQNVQPRACTPEAVARRELVVRGRRISETKLGWCPPDYRGLYRDLMKRFGYHKADAQKIIAEQIKSDLAKMSPFERQERALAKGAILIANDIAPSLANPVDFGERKWG